MNDSSQFDHIGWQRHRKPFLKTLIDIVTLCSELDTWPFELIAVTWLLVINANIDFPKSRWNI